MALPVPFRENKFAFLYSGKTDEKYQRNLAAVYEMLTVFCNYPEENIILLVGDTYDPAILTDVSGIVTTVDEFRQEFYDFATMCADYSPGTTIINTALIYFTGVADDPTDPAGNFNQKNPNYYVTSSLKISPTLLKSAIQGFDIALTSRKDYFQNTAVQICLDIDKAGQMADFFNALTLIEGSYTLSCASGETSAVDLLLNESLFTHYWTRSFRMVKQEVGGSVFFADTMVVGTEDIDNELVSLGKACAYAATAIDNPAQTPAFLYLSTTPGADPVQYLGAPYPEIRDGIPVWQSPDILLRHPVPGSNPLEYYEDVTGEYVDDYELDDPGYASDPDYVFRNHVHVSVWNTGTHPMFHVKVGIMLYETGCGGAGSSTIIEHEMRTLTLSEIIIPVSEPDGVIEYIPDEEDADTQYADGLVVIADDFPFLSDLHRCIRAKAEPGTEPDPDLTVWDIVNLDNEAQRNINYGYVSPMEWDPGEDEGSSGSSGDTGGTGTGASSSTPDTNGITGISKYPFTIKNTFPSKRKYRVVFSRELSASSHLLRFQIMRIDGTVPKPVKLIGLPGGELYFDLLLAAGETAKFLVIIWNRVDMSAYESIDIDVSIFVEKWIGIRGYMPLIRKWTMLPKFILLAGFTIAIRFINGRVRLEIRDKNGKPLSSQWVFLKSRSGLTRALYKTDRNGILQLEGVNPDRYIVELPGNVKTKKFRYELDLKENPYRVLRLKI